MAWQPQLVGRVDVAGNPAASLGHALVDDYLEFVAARCSPNTLLATACDLKVFFSVVPKEPTDVVTADIFAFITAQKKPRREPKGGLRRCEVLCLRLGDLSLGDRRVFISEGKGGYLLTTEPEGQ
ncbi:hypothetical protein AB0D11_46695 [Streptomyces monashensis]|uniref:hypothetical protein n=1 Tax=Streptomyces monashensis TaxID=1678012 RepID=UPI0033DCFFC4